MASVFQSVTARTAGFNTLDLGALGGASALVLMVLMFIGASPGSSGGGVKTATAAVVAVYIRSRLQSRDSVAVFKRSVSMDIVCKAFTLIALSLGLVVVSTMVILAGQPGLSLKEALFEVVSAFGTVGLSLGITPELTSVPTNPSKSPKRIIASDLRRSPCPRGLWPEQLKGRQRPYSR